MSDEEGCWEGLVSSSCPHRRWKAVLGCIEVLEVPEGVGDLAYSIIGHQGQAERHQTASLEGSSVGRGHW